ncbi:MAG: hypothetical protein JXJ19_00935 [Elusimicrobia bacterium]|nr:hypothetical protein [Elusimicrobiota bacterium]
MMRKTAALILISVFAAAAAESAGLLTPFTECSMEGIKPGREYSVKQIKDRPYKVKNSGKDKTSVKMKILKPSHNELLEGYEEIRDTSWIRLERDSFMLEPGEWGVTDIYIKIDGDSRVYGKKYQAVLLAENHDAPGALKIGLRSRILIAVAEKKSIFKKIVPWGRAGGCKNKEVETEKRGGVGESGNKGGKL